MNVAIFAKTDIGAHREQNEDAFVICPNLSSPDWNHYEASVELDSYGCLLAVADGMGGANAGDVAAALAVESIKDVFSSSDLASCITSDWRIKALLNDAVVSADKSIREYARHHTETVGMGTTLVLCWILEGKAYIAWCGDSRCYVFNPRYGIKALTKDHSYVQELINRGELTEDEALTHPDSNLITRGLGDLDAPAKADIVDYAIQPNDMFLLCSDGLCGYCTDDAIERVLRASDHDKKDCCDKLIQLALDAGGYDNICIVLALVDNGTESLNHNSNWWSLFRKLFSCKRG